MDQSACGASGSQPAALLLASLIADAYFGWQSDQKRLLLREAKRPQ